MREVFRIDEPGPDELRPGALGAGGSDRGSPAPTGGDSPLDPRTLLAGLRHRGWVGLVLAPLVAAAGVYVARTRVEPSFAAEALLTVEPTVPAVAVTDEQWRARSIHGFYDEYARTLVERVRTHGVMSAVVARLEACGVDWLPPNVDHDRAPDHLRARLEVRSVRDTHLLAIRFEDTDREVVAPVVNVAAEVLLEHVAAAENRERDQRIAALEVELARVEEELGLTYAELDALSPRLGSALLDERQNPFYERVNTLEEGLTKVLVERAHAEGELERARAEADRLLGHCPEAEVLAAVEADAAVRDARVLLGRLERDEEAATGHLSDEHPDRRRSLRRVDLARERIAALEHEVADRTRARLVAERTERAQELVAAAEARAAAARRSAAEMGAVLETAQADLTEHGRAMFDGSLLRDRADRLLTVIGLLESRLEEARIESRADARVSLAGAGVRPAGPADDRSALLALASIGAALAAGLAGPMVLELLRPRLRRAADLERAGLDTLAFERDAAQRLEARARAGGRAAIAGWTVAPASRAAVAAAARLAAGLALRLGVEPVELVDLREGDAPTAARRKTHAVVLSPVPDAGLAELAAARGLPVVLVAARGDDVRTVARVRRRLETRGARVIGGLLSGARG